MVSCCPGDGHQHIPGDSLCGKSLHIHILSEYVLFKYFVVNF